MDSRCSIEEIPVSLRDDMLVEQLALLHMEREPE